MANLASVALTVAKMVGRADATGATILDLEDEIKDEIINAIKFYNRKPLHLLETRAGTLTTVAAQTWYTEVDTTTTISVNSILDIHYMRENPGASGLNEPMREIAYNRFEQLQEGSTSSGQPEYFTRYAGSIGIWPTPGAVHTLYWSGLVKPIVPSADSDESVWFDEANELIECAAARRVCSKWLRDPERAAIYTAEEQNIYRQLRGEYVSKSTTGRIKPHE